MPLARPDPIPESSTTADQGVPIIIRHPGYEDDPTPMITLAGFDLDGEKKGLHVETASLICAILSGRSNGYFTTERDGSRLEFDHDSLLEKGEYYYCVPDDPLYPIYLLFRHWQFPHNDLQEAYAHAAPASSQIGVFTPVISNVHPGVMMCDQRCIISRQQEFKERAHLCPREEREWFKRNNMRPYTQNHRLDPEDAIDDLANAIALRKELHTAFDRKIFVFVVKEKTWTTHFLQPTFEFGAMYHNMRVTFDESISTQFLFARIAWAVFPLVKAFLVSGWSRWVTVRVEDTQGRTSWVRKFMHRRDICANVSRSSSPQKRQRGQEGGQQKDDDAECREESLASSMWMSDEEQDIEDESDITRGRSKRRRGSYGSQSSLGSMSRFLFSNSSPRNRSHSLPKQASSQIEFPSRRNNIIISATIEDKEDQTQI